MGLINFIKEAGGKLFGQDEKEAANHELNANVLSKHVNALGFDVESLSISVDDDKVSVYGKVQNQEDAEKVALALGNVKGVSKVDNHLKVEKPAPEAKYHTVQKGDSLSKISKEVYGDPMKYKTIFEANKPMLKDPDLIYPGQVLRIPPLGQ